MVMGKWSDTYNLFKVLIRTSLHYGSDLVYFFKSEEGSERLAYKA